MIDLSKKSNYVFSIPDNSLSETFQWQVQEISFPSVTVESARVIKSPKLSGTSISGTATQYDDLQITFLLDEEMLSYAELYKWLLTVQNPVGATTESETNVPRTALLHIMDNINDEIQATFRFIRMFPKSIGNIEWSYTEAGDLQAMTCTVTFDYEYFSMELSDGTMIEPRP